MAKSMNSRQRYRQQLFLSILFFFLWFSGFAIAAESGVILQSQKGYTPISVKLYKTAIGDTHMAFCYIGLKTPCEIYYTKFDDDDWLSPILLNFSNVGSKTLYDVKSRPDANPLMLLGGDDTDYAKLFNVDDMNDLVNENGEFNVPDFSNDDLIELTNNNKRLFYSVCNGEVWTSPKPIPNSYRAIQPVLAVDNELGAIVVYSLDLDKNAQTAEDRELYASVYNGRYWTDPEKLTNNNLVEFSYKVINFGDRFLIMWLIDGDNNIETREDRQLHFAAISKSGAFHTSDTPLFNSYYSVNDFVLASRQNDAFVLWSKSVDADSREKPAILQSIYLSSWSSPQQLDIRAYELSKPEISVEDDITVMIFKEGLALSSIYHDNNGWFPPKTLWNMSSNSWVTQELDYQIVDDQLMVSMVGYVPVLNESEDTQFEIRYLNVPIRPDLGFSNLDLDATRIEVGDTLKLTISVKNMGSVSSGNFQVLISENNSSLATLVGNSLAPSESQNWVFDFKMVSVAKKLLMEIQSETVESNTANNVIEIPIQVPFDYLIKSITVNKEGRIIAEMRERKNLAAPPIEVKFYSLVSGDRQLIHTDTFDPVNAEPISFDLPDFLADLDHYSIVADINPDRTIVEDNIANNQKSYYYHPIPDFAFTSFRVTKKYVYLTVSNEGKQYSGPITYGFYSDPFSASATTHTSASSALYEGQIEMDGTTDTEFQVSFESLGDLSGQTLYVTLNQFDTIKESNRNNNQLKFFITEADISGGEDEELEEVADLSLTVNGIWCNSIEVFVTNSGAVYAVSTTLELVDSSNAIIDIQTLPIIKANSLEKVFFKNVKQGEYTIQLTYEPVVGTKKAVSLNAQVDQPDEQICSGAQSRDIEIVSAEYYENPLEWLLRNMFGESRNRKGFRKRFYDRILRRLGLDGKILVELELSAKNFNRSYRQAVIEVPLTIEIKEGASIKLSEHKTIYMLETGPDQVEVRTLAIPNALVEDSTQISVQIPIRDDEEVGSNNHIELTID